MPCHAPSGQTVGVVGGLLIAPAVSQILRGLRTVVEAMARARVAPTPKPAADPLPVCPQPRDDPGDAVAFQLAYPFACPSDLLTIKADLLGIKAARSVGGGTMA